MNEYFIGYLGNMKALNESFLQSSHKMNEESGESVKCNETMTNAKTYPDIVITQELANDPIGVSVKHRRRNLAYTIIRSVTSHSLPNSF